jgi:hypothetical protein
MQTIEYRQV